MLAAGEKEAKGVEVVLRVARIKGESVGVRVPKFVAVEAFEGLVEVDEV